MLNLKNKRIGIKTYPFDSGLYYLGLMLQEELRKDNEVFLFPKETYEPSGGKYIKKYNIKDDSFFKANEVLSVLENTKKFVHDYKPDIFISMETLMRNKIWIDYLKSERIEVWDFPMIDWIELAQLKNYNIFDKVISTDLYLKKWIKNIEKIDLTFPAIEHKEKYKRTTFYHPASLNSSISSKNTDLVMKAFKELNLDADLIITGQCSSSVKNIICKGKINREEQKDLIARSNFLVQPSKREGLCLPLYEAISAGTDIITTDHYPMNVIQTKWLCKPKRIMRDPKYLGTSAILTVEAIKEQMLGAYNYVSR